MSDLKNQFRLDYFIASNTTNTPREYDRGFEECKKMVIEILSQPLKNSELSENKCDERYIEKIKKL